MPAVGEISQAWNNFRIQSNTCTDWHGLIWISRWKKIIFAFSHHHRLEDDPEVT